MSAHNTLCVMLSMSDFIVLYVSAQYLYVNLLFSMSDHHALYVSLYCSLCQC